MEALEEVRYKLRPTTFTAVLVELLDPEEVMAVMETYRAATMLLEVEVVQALVEPSTCNICHPMLMTMPMQH